LFLLSAGKADNELDDDEQEFAKKVDVGNPLSNEVGGKKLLNNGDKAK